MTAYDAMDLDQLLELSRSDAEHAGDMAEQARVLREMSRDLTDNVDLMRGVMETLFEPKNAEQAPWDSESAKMMKTELDRLFKPASSAPKVLEDNAKAMDDFGTKVHTTLVEIDQLHVKSNGGKNKSDLDKARQVMQDANSGYLTAAEQMPEPEFYNGLRKSADDEPGPWTDRHGATPAEEPTPLVYGQPQQPGSEPAPAPQDGQPSDDGQPTQPTQPTQPVQPTHPTQPVHTIPADTNPSRPELQGPTPGAPPVAPNPGAPPVNPAPNPWSPPVTNPAPWSPPLNPNPVGGPRPIPPVKPIVGRPGPNPLVPRPGPTTPPVIGRPRPPAMPPAMPRPVVPNPNGTVPPVIGTRPGPGGVPLGPRPLAPNGTVPPVIGTRPGPGTVPFGTRPGPGTIPFGTRPLTPGPGGAIPPGGVRPGTGPVPFGARPGVGGPGVVPFGARTGPGGSGNRSTPAPTRSSGPGTTSRITWGVANARPAGGLAFGGANRPVSRPVTTKAAGLPGSRQGEAKSTAKPTGKIPGQRVRRMPRQGGRAVEDAIVRGAQRKPLSRTPGQEVFAKFDAAAKAKDKAEKQPKREIDPDSEWAIRRVSVPAVITTRKAN